MDASKKEKLLADGLRKCVDLSGANISGGTLDGMIEHMVVIEFQHCHKFKPVSECATKE